MKDCGQSNETGRMCGLSPSHKHPFVHTRTFERSELRPFWTERGAHLPLHPARNSLWCCSRHDIEACPNWSTSAYGKIYSTHPHYFLSLAYRCSSMDFTKYFKKESEKSYRCLIHVPVTDDDNVIQEKECRASGEQF